MIRITKPNREVNARIILPASKSISNRLLILQHHYGHSLSVSNLSGADDTILLSSMLTLLKQYTGKGKGLLRMDAHNAGTVFRFMTALLAITPGQFLLTGSARMKERPIGPLVDALRDLGADIEYLERQGYPPLHIKGRNLEGGQVRIDAALSSQFLSALMLISPMMPEGLIVDIQGNKPSWPFVKMTLKLLEGFKIRILEEEDRIRIMPQDKISGEVMVEPDWSASSFWYAMLSMAEMGTLEFPGLNFTGLQGDQAVSRFFEPLGIDSWQEPQGLRIMKTQRAILPARFDFSAHPDLAMPVILSYAALNIGFSCSGLERLRLKESDRLAVMTRELHKTGISLSGGQSGLWQTSGSLIPEASVHVEDEGDHRIALTMACLAVKGHEILIDDPSVVNKSYPGFWNDLKSAGFIITDRC